MSLLANGEIGTDYNDQWTTEGSTGASVSFSASGLPEGLSLDSETGIVSGIPSIAGTFPVTVTASDGTDTIFTNRRIWIVPTPDSEFYWTFSGLPAALFGIEYGRQPPLTVSAANGTLVTYSATGLPSGIEYNATTGELSGSTVEIGIYPVKFTAIDGANTETIVLPFDFIVLPATGGDAKDLPVNLWALRQQIKGGVPGKDSWKASYLYNADRRSGKSFDPETQEFFVSIGNREISLPPGSFIVSASGVMNYRSDKSAIPKVTVKITPAKQNIQLSTAKDTINQTVPATTRNVLMIGNKSYRIDEAFDAKGKLTVPSGYRSTCFVLSDGQIILKGAGKDTAKFNFLLGDPAFACAQGTPIEFTVQDGEGTYIAKPDFSDLLSVQQVTVKDIEVCKIKQSGKDATPDTTLKKFSYTTQTGKMSLSLANMTITGLSGEKHLLFELRIGDKTYTTTVTFFERSPGKFATKY
jgi:hypothetical protein